uniref:Uncharacterized protein n=1 Tax=Arundo donax TaxID=35708 RepID=A0A0A9EEE0_ARUDO
MACDLRRRMAPTTVACGSKAGPPCAARRPSMTRRRRSRTGSGGRAHTEYTSSGDWSVAAMRAETAR